MQNRDTNTFKQSKNSASAQRKSFFRIPTYPQHLIQPLLNLYINLLKEPVGGKLLTLLFLILPWDLGKHLEVGDSYIGSILVPYLVPTVYLQDVLVALIVLASLRHRKATRTGVRSAIVPVRLFFLSILAYFLSVFFTTRLTPSLYFSGRLLLYFLFFTISLSLFKREFIRRAFFISLVVNLILLIFLGLAQFKNQSAVFNNYLFFGEQPYNLYTPFIAKESYGGVAKIPPYGTFQHPNIFAGFFVISLTLAIWCFVSRRARSWELYILLATGLLLGLYILFLTKSLTAWVALVFGLVLIFGVKTITGMRPCAGLLLAVSLGLGIIGLGLALPLIKEPVLRLLPAGSVLSTLSVERRSSLLTASYKMLLERPFFGWGINSFTYNFESFYMPVSVVRFLQPVHSVYALIASEVGLFGVVFFVALTFYAIYYSVRHGNPLYSVVLLQIIFLSSFDHYFFTIHQTLLLYILTLLLALTYTKDTDCL